MFFFYSLNSLAQVTIGIPETPVQGALLQLKNNANISGGADNSTKGLGLPRVFLHSLGIDGDLGDTMGHETGSLDPDSHTGLLVYNINECMKANNESSTILDGLHEGLYVWDGKQWQPLFEELKTGTVTGISGVTYKTQKFGTAGEWMIENIREREYDIDGVTAHPVERDNVGDDDNYYYYYPGSKTDAAGSTVNADRLRLQEHPNYGLLYTWRAATNGVQSDAVAKNVAPTTTGHVQGICPRGWHIPSEKDWLDLEKEATVSPSRYSSVSNVGYVWNPAFDYQNDWRPAGISSNDAIIGHGKVFLTKCDSVYQTTTGNLPFTDIDGKSRKGGFNALPVGYVIRAELGAWGTNAYFWSSTKYTPTGPGGYETEGGESVNKNDYAWYRAFGKSNLRKGGYRRDTACATLFSVRCKKD